MLILLVDVNTQRLELLTIVVGVTVDIQGILIADIILVIKPSKLFNKILYTNLTLKFLMPLPLKLSMQFRILLTPLKL